MYKNLRWKFLTILAVAAIAIVAFYPPQNKVKLGLDLKGGVAFTLEADQTALANQDKVMRQEKLAKAFKKMSLHPNVF